MTDTIAPREGIAQEIALWQERWMGIREAIRDLKAEITAERRGYHLTYEAVARKVHQIEDLERLQEQLSAKIDLLKKERDAR